MTSFDLSKISERVLGMATTKCDDHSLVRAVRLWGHDCVDSATREEMWLVIGFLCGRLAGGKDDA